MANEIITSTLLSEEVAAQFSVSNSFLATANRKYDGMFQERTYKPGQTINIRLDNQHVVQRGNSATATELKETWMPLQLQQLFTVYEEYDTIDLTVSLGYENWKKSVLKGMVNNIISQINAANAADAKNSVYLTTGTPGTALNTFGAINNPGIVLGKNGVQFGTGWNHAMTFEDAGALKDALSNSFNTTINNEINRYSQLGHLSYFDIYEESSIDRHQSYIGDYGAPVINGAVTSGSTLVAAGFTGSITDILRKGDTITITHPTAQPYFVNRVTKVSTGQPVQFVVTADVTSTAGGAATIPVGPEINISADDPNQNISAEIPDGAVIKVTRKGTVADGEDGLSNINLAYSSSGLFAVCPPLELLRGGDSDHYTDPETGWSGSL